MRILFFLVVIANVALFMWEYKTGAFAPLIQTTSHDTAVDQEQILLVTELKNIPEPIIPAPVLKPPVSETVLIEETGAASEVLPSAIEGIDKSAISAPVLKPPVAKTALIEEVGVASDLLSSESGNIDKTDPNDLTAQENTKQCYEVGPFVNNKAYHGWTNRLKDINSDIRPVSRNERTAGSYMVYYPAAENAAQSEVDIQMLKSHGIKDLWLLTGEDKDDISLGVFKTETSASTMKSELLAKGINAEVKTRYKIKARKYALIKGDDKLAERLETLKKTYPLLTVKQIQDVAQGC